MVTQTDMNPNDNDVEYLNVAVRIKDRRTSDSRTLLAAQFLCLAEETGESIQAARQFYGLGVRKEAYLPETFEKLKEELADVVITAQVTARLCGIDLEREIASKLQKIKGRGGV